jgi:rhodanese-related sulfurtransferase
MDEKQKERNSAMKKLMSMLLLGCSLALTAAAEEKAAMDGEAKAPKATAKKAEKVQVPTVTTDELSGLIDGKKAVVFDARIKKEDDKRRLPGATLLSSVAHNDVVAAALPDKAAAVVIYGQNRDDEHAVALGRRLLKMGYTNVKVYADGVEGWTAAGKKVEEAEKDKKAP